MSKRYLCKELKLEVVIRKQSRATNRILNTFKKIDLVPQCFWTLRSESHGVSVLTTSLDNPLNQATQYLIWFQTLHMWLQVEQWAFSGKRTQNMLLQPSLYQTISKRCCKTSISSHSTSKRQNLQMLAKRFLSPLLKLDLRRLRLKRFAPRLLRNAYQRKFQNFHQYLPLRPTKWGSRYKA